MNHVPSPSRNLALACRLRRLSPAGELKRWTAPKAASISWMRTTRGFTLHSLLLAVFVLCSVHAQSYASIPRVGFLAPSTPEGSAFVLAGLRQGLREKGYVDGANVVIEPRYAHDRFDRLPELARDLIDSKVDVLVTFVTQASIAAKENTRTIPIVMVAVSDPVASGLVSSLSRPGGNVTGTSGAFTGLVAKVTQLLQEMTPGASRIAVLWNPANRVFQAQMLKEATASAKQLGLDLQLFEARDARSIEMAFDAISRQRLTALSVLPDPVFAANWDRIATLAKSSRLPSVTVSGAYAEAGGLMTYGPSLADSARLAASYVAKILKGAKPADIPVEQPTKFELVINLRTAKQIGVTVPQPLLLRADRLIQ